MHKVPTCIAALVVCLGARAFAAFEWAEDVVATVNGRPIRAAAFAEGLRVAVARMNFSAPREPSEARTSAIQRLGTDVLRRLVEESIIRNEARKRGIKVSGLEVRTRRRHEEAKFSSEAEFRDMLLRRGLSVEAYDRELELGLLEKRLAAAIQNEPPTDEEVAQYYQAHWREFGDDAPKPDASPVIPPAVEKDVRARASERKRKFGYLDWLRSALGSAEVNVLVDEVEVPQLGATTPVKWRLTEARPASSSVPQQ
ncbi:MAG: SurA N-terminal domain-containing protein [Armatimonadota bacterium]